MSPSPRRRTTLLVAAGAVLLGSCSSAAEVGIPDDADHEACVAASEHWPEEVKELSPTETDPSDPAVAAWGDPPIIARCGMPALGPTEDQCVVVDDVDWVAEELDDGTRLTSFGRDPAIEVIVPEEHDPAPMLLPAFSEAVQELPTNGRECT
ncbi:MAG TPA: DUF3515 domain-containing protein [Candidatus Janibacter merdipullorum]|nr:DUF3515 domain-containing protein [Candidatus Janibacter merdipullorum]